MAEAGTRSQVVLERVHVGRQVADPAESEGEPDSNDKRDHVKTTCANGAIVDGRAEVVEQALVAEARGPFVSMVVHRVGSKCVDGDGDEVEEGREGLVGGRGSWSSAIGFASVVVDAVDGVEGEDAGL